jgi:hypothetical protein
MNVNLNTSYDASSPARVPAASSAPRKPALPAPSGASVFEAVQDTLAIGSGARDIWGSVQGLDEEGVKEFLSTLAVLLREGVVGTESLEVNGERYESFVSTRLGSEELRHARQYRPDPPLRPRLNYQA